MSYNGWSNRATWNVSLWLNNDEGLYRQLQAEISRAESVEQLAGYIEDLARAVWPNGKTPDGASLAEADFEEIAQGEWDDSEHSESNKKPSPLSDFITRHKITFEAHRVASRPDGLMADGKEGEMRHWRCRITCPSKTRTILSDAGREPSFGLYFSQGSAHTEAPTLADVLDCLASDASSFENVKNGSAEAKFEDWASEFGYETDSRKAERIFRAVKRQAEQLRRVLGQDAYDELLWKTERL